MRTLFYLTTPTTTSLRSCHVMAGSATLTII